MRWFPADGVALLKQRDFLLFVLQRMFGNIGAQMLTVAVGWQVYDKTGNPLDLGWIGLSQFAPFVVLILPAGHFADHHDRRRILSACYLVHVLCAMALAMYTWSAATQVWPIFMVMTVLGMARAFATPASQSLLPNLVMRELFGRAIAYNFTLFQVATILGPVLGGLLLLAGMQAVYAAVMICGVVCMAAVRKIQYRHVAPAQPAVTAAAESGVKALLKGLSFVRAQPLVLGAISLDLVAVLFGGATALLPIYAGDILHVGPTGLGMLRSATGVGALICAIGLSVYPITRHVGRWLFGSVSLFGVSTIVFGASTSFVLSLVALTMLGASDMVSVFVRHYLVQLMTPDAIRGRVSAVSSVFIGASNELGEFESGVTAAWWGAVGAVIVGGSVTMVLTLWWMRLFPALRNMDRFPEPMR
ncbi:MAG: MFS transporter [Steroidobacteraceae bacterium]